MPYSPDRPLYAFFGHHKCATGWIDDILREACFRLGWDFRIVHRPVDFAAYGALHRLAEAERPDFLAYTNADRADLDGLPPFRGFHVIRDPRDVIVSGYFSHRYSHPTDGWPELAAHRAQLQQMSKEDGLLEEMAFSAERLRQMGAWDYAQPNVMEVKMEHLTAAPHETFCAIFDFLGILDRTDRSLPARVLKTAAMQLNALNQRGRHRTPFGLPISPVRIPQRTLAERHVAAVLRRKSFKKLSGGRKKGQENVRSHYRKGQPGDWRNHFTAAHAAHFAERFGGLLVRLGYEPDDRWVARHEHSAV